MHFEIVGNPDYGELNVALGPDEELLVESGSMSRMSPDLQVKATTKGGFFKALGRKFLAGESLLLGRYFGPNGGALALSPSCPGHLLHRKLNGETFRLTAGSFLACTPGVHLKTKFGGFRSLLSREGAFLLQCSGTGDLFFNAFGAVLEKEVDGSFAVDTGHLVAFEESLEYRLGGMGGLKQTLFSGEGLIMRFEGRGKIWVQTRTMGELASWLTPFC